MNLDPTKTKISLPSPARQALESDSGRKRLRVLFVGPDPLGDDYPPIDIAREWQGLTSALMRMSGPVALVRLIPPSFRELNAALTSQFQPYPVIHIFAHRTADSIVLEREDGKASPKPIEDIAKAFVRGNVELVVLNVRSSESLAHRLVENGIAHVIGTRSEVLEQAAKIFAEGLYLSVLTEILIDFSRKIKTPGFESPDFPG